MNVRNTNNTPGFKGIHVVYGLDGIDAKRIRETPEVCVDFENKYGIANQSKYYEALWLCNHQFKTLDKNKYFMRIFLFTNEDNPNSDDQNLRNQLVSHIE